MNYKWGVLAILLLYVQIGKANKIYREYIETYSVLAQEQMRKYHIPASITLAQGLLESGAGKGRLARIGNNHFGIKCHDWNGQRIYHDDDAHGECFRKYRSVRESYEDHSKFLVNRPRYQALFSLNDRDYKAWAKGLKRAGYATDPNYANKLIKIIEDYELYRYDRSSSKTKKASPTLSHNAFRSNNLLYIKAKSGDTFHNLGKEFGIRSRKLASYNELPVDIPLEKGDIVYLQKKKNKAAKMFRTHKVLSGESMHSISQRYGIQLKALYKMNRKDFSYVPEEGEVLRLR